MIGNRTDNDGDFDVLNMKLYYYNFVLKLEKNTWKYSQKV